jgi:pimeloyl-ACP methyl ester carboxylesterase
MNRYHTGQVKQTKTENSLRKQLIDGLQVTESRVTIYGVNSAILEGGDGPPLVLLHGPGESSFWWMNVLPELVKTHRVIAPDLPGHGESEITDNTLENEQVMKWLDELIRVTCSIPPVIAGHALGGAIAARYAIQHDEQLQKLVLVDSLGLARFRPAPMFAFRLIRYMINPNEKTYSRFLPECIYDIGHLRKLMGDKWDPFLAYNLDNSRFPEKKAALKTLMKSVGVPKIPADDLARIPVPVNLIWGRHDRANRLSIAETVSNRFGWPLQVIENSGDDPKLEQPEAFLKAFYAALETGSKDGNTLLRQHGKHETRNQHSKEVHQ